MSILDEIVAVKREEVAAAKRRLPAAELARQAESAEAPVRGFRQALIDAPAPAVIAELKRRSPSKGEIRPGFEPVACARGYAAGGAAALSVLTDERYFGGCLAYLAGVREAVPLPLLRKDFTVDRYQVDESRIAGADAILLIVAALAPEQVREFSERARELLLDVLVEVHDEAELEVALASGATLVGVNNRDLRSFEVDLGTTQRLAARIPQGADVVLVAESGIGSPADVEQLQQAGAGAFLVGESLMRQSDLTLALRNLMGPSGDRQEEQTS